MSEISGSGFPPEEFVPLWLPNEGEPRGDVHIGQLTPDPEARMSLKSWAQLGAELARFRPSEGLLATVKGSAQWFELEYPMFHDWGNLPTSISARVVPFSEAAKNAGQTQKISYLNYDMARPGFAEIKDVTLTTDLTGADGKPEEIYFTEDGEMIRHVTASEIVDDKRAVQLSEDLKQSRLLSEDEKEAHRGWGEAYLEQMNSALRKAFIKHILNGEPLGFDPERDLQIDWGSVVWRHTEPVFFTLYPGGTSIYYPPYMQPDPMSQDMQIYMDTKESSPFLWTKASWDEEFDPSTLALRQEKIEDQPELEQIDIRRLKSLLPGNLHSHLEVCVSGQLIAYISAFRQPNGGELLDKWGEGYDLYRKFVVEHFPQILDRHDDLFPELGDLRRQIGG